VTPFRKNLYFHRKMALPHNNGGFRKSSNPRHMAWRILTDAPFKKTMSAYMIRSSKETTADEHCSEIRGGDTLPVTRCFFTGLRIRWGRVTF
jgi:hypothetical protein